MAARISPGGGLKQEKIWRDAVLRAVKRKIDGNSSTYLERLADTLVECGLKGDVVAIKEVGDRLDGRVAQSIFDELPENGRLVLVWESNSPADDPLIDVSSSPIALENNSSPSTIENSDTASALPIEEPAKPSPTSTS